MIFILCTLWWIRIRGLWKLPDGKDWLKGKLSLVLMGGAMFSKSLIQFSHFVNEWGCLPSLSLDLRSSYGIDNEDNGNLLQKVPHKHCCTQCIWLFSRLPLTQTSIEDSWILMGMTDSVSYWLTAPFFWILVHTKFCLCPKSLFPQSCVSSVIKSHWLPKSNSLGVLSPFARSPGWEICCGS